MKAELNIDNVKIIITEIFKMSLSEISLDVDGIEHLHYYKSVKSVDFEMFREYRLIISDDGHFISINYRKILDSNIVRNDYRDYIKKGDWSLLIRDFAMRTFSVSDSYNEEDIESGLDSILRSQKIDELLEN